MQSGQAANDVVSLDLEAITQFGREAGEALYRAGGWVNENPIVGSLVSLGGLIFVLLVLLLQNQNSPTHVRQYRHYEMALIIKNKLSVHRLVDYHRGIAWRDFAAISSATGIGGAALLSGGYQAGTDVWYIIVVSVGFQVASAIMMMICDFIHTNTISPIVPPLQRLRIVGDAIVLGGAAMITNISALTSFMAVFSPWVSIFCTVIFVFVIWRLTALRAIKVTELMRWCRIKDQATWDEIDALVRTTSKKERDRLLEQWYYEQWSINHEEPR